MASCNTSCDRPLFDGIGSVSAGMMSSVGLELTSYINPELSWKTVSKGNRSGTRRTRKPGARSLTMGMGPSDQNSRTLEDVTVSESEKLGVDVLGQRFSEKVENVPIKKRRFIVRSPSPPLPLTPSPHLEASAEHVDSHPDLGQNSGSSSANRRRLLKCDRTTKSTVAGIGDEKSAEVINDVEDFSRIEILAAAACSDDIHNVFNENEGTPVVEESTQERIELSVSATHMEETTASLKAACCSPKSSLNESKTEGSTFHDNFSAVLHESSIDKDNTSVERSNRLPDDKLLWDLNLSMDAWPCDDETVNSEKDAAGDKSVVSDGLLPNESEDIICTDKASSCNVDGSNNLISDLVTMHVETDDLNIEKLESEECSGSGENKTEHVPVPALDAENSLVSTIVDLNAEAVNIGQCLGHPPFPGSDKVTLVSHEDRETSSLPTHNAGLKAVGCLPGAGEGKTACVERVQVEESDVAISFIPVMETVANDNKSTSSENDDKDHDGDYGLHDVEVFAQDMDNSQPPKSLEVEDVDGAEEMDIYQFSPMSEDMSISDEYVMPMERIDGASSAYTAQDDAVSHVGSEVLLQKSLRNFDVMMGEGECPTHQARRIYVNGPTCYMDKASLNDTPKESHDLAVSKIKEPAVGMGGCSEFQGYDSQFEDGELRESDVQCWEEAEQVDYDTDFEEEESLGLETESGEQKLQVERCSSPDVIGNYKYSETGEVLRENSVSLKLRTVQVLDGETKFDCLDGSNVGNYDLRVDLSKVSKRGSLPHVERSLSSDALQRNRSDNLNGSYFRSERNVGSDKFMGRNRSTAYMRVRSPVGGHFYSPSSNYWDSKRQQKPIYHGPYNFRRPRLKTVVERRGYPIDTDQAPPEVAGVVRPDSRVGRQFMGSTNDVYRPFLRRKLPVKRDYSYGIHARMGTITDTSPDRTRFRRYPQSFNRGIKDEFLRHFPDDGMDYLNRMPHYFGRRERSISPHGGRPHYAVSRSRSPVGLLLQRERNEGSRQRSRSPDFRSDARIDWVRLPLTTKHLGADYGEEFISLPRSRIEPQRNSRMLEGLDHFRARKSPPVRMFRQGQRFDQVRPIRRLNSDDYFGPMIRPRRFPEMAADGEGCKYEGSDEDKHGSRYEMIRRVRQYDTNGAVRQFRYNAEATYVANNNSLTVTNTIEVSSRSPDDAPRTATEDGSLKAQP